MTYLIIKYGIGGIHYWNGVEFTTIADNAEQFDTYEKAFNTIYINKNIPIGGLYQVIPITIKK